MPKNVFRFSCPCCGKEVEVDTRSGKARAVDPNEKKGKDFETLVTEQHQASERFDSMFDSARRDQERQKNQLERLFEDAAEKAKHDEDKRPSNPFDLE
ncbi:MAG: hypothetical protein KDB80_15125 [Planctomycetes bacterium]|nr:hypothetical protein [Planctomycetota bacterium]